MKRLVIALVAVLLVLSAGLAVGLNLLRSLGLAEPAHKASAMVLVKPDWHGRWDTGVDNIKFIPPAVPMPQWRVHRMADAIEQPAIAREATRRLGLLKSQMKPKTLLENLTVEEIPDTGFIKLSYKDSGAQRAKRIVNAVAEVSAEQIRQETPYDYDFRVRVLP